MDKLNLGNYYKHNTKVLDVYSTNGLFSSGIYNSILPEQYIMMENRHEFRDFLLEYKESQAEPNNLQLRDLDPYSWKSFIEITDNTKLLQPGFQSRDHVHTEFLLAGSCTNEGLLMQWLACLGNQNWIQRFGNVKMLLWVPNSSAIKIMATPGANSRAKCSLTRETFSNTKIIAVPDDKDLKKYNKDSLSKDETILMDPSEFSNKALPLTLLEIDPLDHNLDTYSWEYVVKHLMSASRKPLHDSVNFLGPAAYDFFVAHLPVEYWSKTARELTSEEVKEIVRVFELWPFKPTALVGGIDEVKEL